MQKLPPLKTLPAFIAVAKQLSFTKAADELCVTHSAVSQSVKLLEGFLNVELFRRQGKQVSLTKAGEIYYRQIASALNTISDATQQLKTQKSNHLTITVATTLAMHWLIARMPDFQKQYPNINLRLASACQVVDFKMEQVDCAILSGLETQWPIWTKEFLFKDELVLVGPPKLKCKKEWGELFKQYKAIYVDIPTRKNDWANWCKAMKLKRPIKSSRMYMQNSIFALQAVASGLGILVTHKPFVADALAAGHLKLVSKDSVQLPTAYYLLYPSDGVNNENIQRFSGWLRDVL